MEARIPGQKQDGRRATGDSRGVVMRWSFLLFAGSLTCPLAFGCSESALTGTRFIDGGVPPLCNDDTPCPEDFVCVLGACEPDPTLDAGVDVRRLQVCTPTNCSDPLTLNFDGPRIGTVLEQTVTLRSIGAGTVTIQNVSLLDGASEFTVDPSGSLDTTLATGEDAILRIRHTAVDGTADRERLRIVSDALRSVILVDVRTEFRGVPTLFVGDAVTQNDAEVEILDFGNVRAGVVERRTLFIKNRDLIIDGSVLEVADVRTEPGASTNFEVTVDQPLPVFLNQYRAICSSDDNCDQERDDACDPTVGACRTLAGPLRDALTVGVDFVGTTAGRIEASLVVVSTSGGAGLTTRTIVLRADVSASQIAVDPDPIEFPESYLGFPDERAVTIRNRSATPVVVNAVELAEPSTFSLSLSGPSLPATLGAGETLAATVTYAPTMAASDESTLVIESSDPIEPVTRVRVTGRALVPPVLVVEPGVINFGDIDVPGGGQPARAANGNHPQRWRIGAAGVVDPSRRDQPRGNVRRRPHRLASDSARRGLRDHRRHRVPPHRADFSRVRGRDVRDYQQRPNPAASPPPVGHRTGDGPRPLCRPLDARVRIAEPRSGSAIPDEHI